MNRSAPQWNAYVESGSGLEGRRARLAEVPASMRGWVESHLRTVFGLRSATHRAWCVKFRAAYRAKKKNG